MSETRRPRRILRRIIGGVLIAGLLAIVILYIAADMTLNRTAMDGMQKNVTSKDGTIIAYEQTGTGPVVILVAAALADRGDTRRLAKHLAEHFTVINYDRRGRGKSTDTRPYAVQREVEDIEALIDANGGPAFVFGSSSGSALALEAASKLGSKVKKLFMYEPPFIVDNSRPPIPSDFSSQVSELVSAGRRDDAVKLFFAKGIGIPNFAVTLMRLLMPGWSKMAGRAHTIPTTLPFSQARRKANHCQRSDGSTLRHRLLWWLAARVNHFFTAVPRHSPRSFPMHSTARCKARAIPRCLWPQRPLLMRWSNSF